MPIVSRNETKVIAIRIVFMPPDYPYFASLLFLGLRFSLGAGCLGMARHLHRLGLCRGIIARYPYSCAARQACTAGSVRSGTQATSRRGTVSSASSAGVK